MKEKNFFDLSEEEQGKIILYAARKSNKEQARIVELAKFIEEE